MDLHEMFRDDSSLSGAATAARDGLAQQALAKQLVEGLGAQARASGISGDSGERVAAFAGDRSAGREL